MRDRGRTRAMKVKVSRVRANKGRIKLENKTS